MGQFYISNNTAKYEDGVMELCKDCMTMMVDNWDPKTYLWILQEADVPYIQDEWNGLMLRYAQDPSKVKGTTIVGRYLSKMKLKQFKNYRWADTEMLQELQAKKVQEALDRQGMTQSQIDQVLQNNVQVKALQEPIEAPDLTNIKGNKKSSAASGDEDSHHDPFALMFQQEEEDLGLTEEDKTFLRLKWGKTYRQEEWVWLEQLYNDMEASYDIQGAGHEDTLKLLCKTSLKCNQLIDIGDVEGFQKMSRAYDSLMKSGKFTAAQNKAESGEYVDSVSELVMLCEQQGYIERYYITDPKDKVDETLEDMKRYTNTLVSQETNLTNMIDIALKNIQREDKEAEENDTGEVLDDDFSIEDIENQLTDNDFADFEEFQNEEFMSDEEIIKYLTEQQEE